MRVHPAPAGGRGRKKDLRRLPHVFSKVLELPLPAVADVAVFEGPDAFHFVVPGGAGAVRLRTVRVHPGVTRVVVVQGGAEEGAVGDEMELDRWRFRLPEGSRPAKAVAGHVDGQLVVTVPKGPGDGDGDGEDGVWRCFNGGRISGKLVAVQ